MLHIYGTPLSSPTNKVRYVASYLHIPYEFHSVKLSMGEQRKPDYLKINPYGKVPAIDDDGFKLAESNAIIRYLADKQQSPIYPKELKQRAIVDQWIDFATQHVMFPLGKIMFNTYFYKFAGSTLDERSLADGRKFIEQNLPLIEQQLQQNVYITGNTITLADIVLIASLDVAELAKVDLSIYPVLSKWRKKLMQESFYRDQHESYTETFNSVLSKVNMKAI